VQPTTDLSEPVWRALAAREAICLVTDLDGPQKGRTTWFTIESLATGHDTLVGGGAPRHDRNIVQLFGRGVSTTAVTALPNGTEVFVDALWPTTRLIVGDGLVAAALRQLAVFLDWAVVVVADVDVSEAAVETLSRGDAVVVLAQSCSPP
jgi:hypothetical protein